MAKPKTGTERKSAIVDLAIKQHVEDGVLEVHCDAKVSEGDDNGAYVQAWVWVDFSGTEFDREG